MVFAVLWLNLAALFAFLSQDHPQSTHADHAELALHADPAFWRYGLLSFCAKTCESKTAEVGGIPALRTIEEGTPALEPNRNALALMQTVIMSFGRNLYLGKPDLPISDTHVYFPVQIVHTLMERFRALQFQEITPQEGRGYRHNSGQNEANNSYIIVRAYEGQYDYNNRPAVPHTPKLAQAYKQGILDANYGQTVSFASTYKCCFRLEVPVWYDVDEGRSPPTEDQPAVDVSSMAKPVLLAETNTREQYEDMQAGTDHAQAKEHDEGEEEDETYLVPAGYGCFSFQRGLLHRAARTYQIRSAGNKYEIIAAWLLEGLAVTISRKNWNILSRTRTCTSTDNHLLQTYFLHGFPSGESDNVRRPYLVPHPKTLFQPTWEQAVARISYPRYLQHTFDFGEAKKWPRYLQTINRANPIEAAPEHLQEEQGTTAEGEGALPAGHHAPPSSSNSPASSSLRDRRNAPQ